MLLLDCILLISQRLGLMLLPVEVFRFDLLRGLPLEPIGRDGALVFLLVAGLFLLLVLLVHTRIGARW